LLVLDEPTANLDPDGAAALIAELHGLRDRRAATIVLIEHRVEQAWPLADVVLALDAIGRPIDVGQRDEVAARSGKPMAAAGIWLPAGVGPRSRRRRVFAADGPAAVPPILVGRGVRFGYAPARPVVRDVSVTVRPGERLALVGPNGS